MKFKSNVFDYNVLNGFFIIRVSICFLGKVHGSLARAGKVKGQTPKVSIKI